MGVMDRFDKTGDSRYDSLPEGFISAEPRPDPEGVCRFLMEPTDISVEALQAIGEAMGIVVESTPRGNIITFPVPYTQVLRLQWCSAVRKLAIYFDVEWPHLRDLT